MPLTKIGRNVRINFINEYGKRRGNNYFYAFMNKYPKRANPFHLEKNKGVVK